MFHVNSLPVSVPAGETDRVDILILLESSIHRIREILQWCSIYTSMNGVDSNGLDYNADLINCVKGIISIRF